jgi:hypothetical protein
MGFGGISLAQQFSMFRHFVRREHKGVFESAAFLPASAAYRSIMLGLRLGSQVRTALGLLIV